MITIKDFLNKIKWDKRLKPEEYSIFYMDRVENKLIEIKYNDIKRIEGTFMIIDKDLEEVNIPLHRIREVRRNKKLVWKREL